MLYLSKNFCLRIFVNPSPDNAPTLWDDLPEDIQNSSFSVIFHAQIEQMPLQ